VLCLVLAAILDVVVAAALLSVFKTVSPMVANTAAWFRVAYPAVFLVAITQLAGAPALLSTPTSVLNAIDSYNTIWPIGLMLFAVHLLLIGYLGFHSGFMPRVLGALIAIAGIGYLTDGIGTILIAEYEATISRITFVGEVALIGWLLWKASRRLARALPRVGELAIYRMRNRPRLGTMPRGILPYPFTLRVAVWAGSHCCG
jgi:hypothetical protein